MYKDDKYTLIHMYSHTYNAGGVLLYIFFLTLCFMYLKVSVAIVIGVLNEKVKNNWDYWEFQYDFITIT